MPPCFAFVALCTGMQDAQRASSILLFGRYGMREALAIVSVEGLPALWERHNRVHKALWKVHVASAITLRYVDAQLRS